MNEITSCLLFRVCLGVILLAFVDGTTSSNLSEKLIRLSNKNEDSESSSWIVVNPVQENQEEEQENKGDLKQIKDFKVSDFENENYKSKESTKEEKEKEKEEEEKVQTTIPTMINNETNVDILEELENVSSIAVTTTIESTSSSPFLDNELESFDRMEKQILDKYNDENDNLNNTKNVSLHSNETKSTTNVPESTLPVSSSLSLLNIITDKKQLELTEANFITASTIRDTSIYENTIGRKDSEKKIIVTEPSVVLENSIQQSEVFGNSFKTSNNSSMIESTSSVSLSNSSTSTESSSIGTSTIETLTTRTFVPYIQSESNDPSDLTGNKITESVSSNTVVSMTTVVTSDSSVLEMRTTEENNSTTKETFTDDNYSTIGTGDTDFSTETTLESSDQSSVNPTTSSSSYSNSTVEYEFVGLTENSSNTIATTTLIPEETLSVVQEQTGVNITNNVSDLIESTRSLSEIASWSKSISVEHTLPVTSSSKTIITSSSSTPGSTENNMMISVESTTESYDATPLVNVVTLDLPTSTFITTFRDKLPTGKKSIDTIPTTSITNLDTLPPDEITSLVRIVLEGTKKDVCPRLEELRQFLANILSNGLDKVIQGKQVRFHRNPCTDSTDSSSTNNSSSEESVFTIYVYIVNENGRFDAAMTKILPNFYKTPVSNFPIIIRSFALVQERDSSNAIAVVVVSSVAFICLLLLAGLLFVMRKRQTRFNYGERCRPVSLDAYSLDSVSAYNSVRRKGVARSSKRSYGNPAFEDSSAVPSHPLNFTGLTSFSNDVDAINEEFLGIPQVSSKMDELPSGAEVKNRYANVIPLPESRVPLKKLNDDPLSEYINASYVRGPKNAIKYYIACQAPLDTTVTDFWRMIWEQQSKVIIMLTDLVENGVEKCTEYIPPSEVTDCHRLYGDFQVTLKKRETKEKYAISTLHLKNLENNTFREVYHIWYLWPASGVQTDGAGLIAVLLEARALQRGGPGPIVVHCSPGTGRTGTLIALDLGIRQYEITRTVDVPRVVYTIRRDRAGAVQTKEQYTFIYKALNLYATKLAGGMLEST
ncbi:PREDICTED: receptor-type tyrosine-protein phosphatase F [Polistes canadensis]|uniref:receptor-type tyrosine-protein phosphatase F n=1 Tax=Polistes canadensis TaxID=91411 RepID=UPI000718DC04|nr:PREDICTED: receptor-type tyrosine-protein phosphatase F [Polistes canadensis]XP_014603170.1 PREDICTED: receptor-type tyrosine-protein phosphatase F [Polistes canadensis]XP_014603171.1 PREDICTED: receptor-type tyrosine-protein phosphatase F [Polistes canadensis]XP_014603173.1 PREDICTED: receptor-type tyrosine-protein phosphatase F [Polistes canadensis]XP_014603174.1 PREDICTED: receptor-type tyrosine-protein phosphatase F [Polistes canadensis]